MVRTDIVCLDTHAVVWIVGGASKKIGAHGRTLIAAAELVISPAVQLELQFLYEIGRVAAPATDAIETLRRGLNLRIATDRFDDVVTFAIGEAWTRDPFDRLIVAHARMLNAVLLSRDRRVAAAYAGTRW